jgi:hypothetical protein
LPRARAADSFGRGSSGWRRPVAEVEERTDGDAGRALRRAGCPQGFGGGPGGPAVGLRCWEDAGITRSSVAADVLGVSGRAMLQGPGRRHPRPAGAGRVGQGRLRAKLPALREALAGRFRTEHHGLLVAQILAHIDSLDEAIAVLSARIARGGRPRSPSRWRCWTPFPGWTGALPR